jgi:hypothetical protein
MNDDSHNFQIFLKTTCTSKSKQKQKLSTMKKIIRLSTFLMSALLITLSFKGTAQQNIALQHDGQHDFDFNIGIWKTHISRLVKPLSGSKTWTELNGTVTVRKVWDGRAQIEEIEADGSSGHFEGLTLFLYNPKSHQWSQSFANSNEGIIDQPSIGEFKDGRGEFYQPDVYNGRSILVRMVWSDITPTSHRVEQSFSDDGGKTWEPNFIGTLTKSD